MSMEQTDASCRKMSQVVLAHALRTLVQGTQAGKLAKLKPSRAHAAHWDSLGELGKLLGVSPKSLGMSLPGCSEQCAGDRTPQLGAGGPLRKGKRDPLSDKDLKAVVDDAVEDGLSPGGCPAILLKHHRCHTFVKRL